jgi:hypothetical protein
MSLEEALAENTAALNRNSDLLERVVAGQEAAIEKLAAGGGSTRKPRGTKTETAPQILLSRKPRETRTTVGRRTRSLPTRRLGRTMPRPAAEASDAAPAGVATIVAGITNEEQMKAYVTGWTGSTEDAAERAKRVELLKGIAGQARRRSEVRRTRPAHGKVVFFIERAKASARRGRRRSRLRLRRRSGAGSGCAESGERLRVAERVGSRGRRPVRQSEALSAPTQPRHSGDRRG